MSVRQFRIAILAFLATFGLAFSLPMIAPHAAHGQTEIACGDEEEPTHAVDEDGILLDPDDSTEEERAADYDDSGEDQEIPEDEGDDLTPEERAAAGNCLEEAVGDSYAGAAAAFDRAWDGVKPLLLGSFGAKELPYGGTAEFRIEVGTGATAGRASASAAKLAVLGKSRIKLRSGDTKKLKLRLNKKGLKRLRRKGRIVATGRLTLTDDLSGEKRTKTGRIVLKLKR